MNKKFITAMIIAFIAVKNPVIALAEADVAYAAEPQTIEKANAVSEANIALNLESLSTQKFKNTDQIAENQLALYRKSLEEEKIKAAQAEEARIAAENVNRVQKLNKAGLSTQFINNYVKAENIYRVPWEILAAVHYTETHQSGDTAVTSYAGAQGPMQFMPSTFRAFAQDGDGNGSTSIGDVDDAIYTAANYLASNGAANGNVVAGLYRYNHDYGYVYHVLSIARSIGYNK